MKVINHINNIIIILGVPVETMFDIFVVKWIYYSSDDALMKCKSTINIFDNPEPNIISHQLGTFHYKKMIVQEILNAVLHILT